MPAAYSVLSFSELSANYEHARRNAARAAAAQEASLSIGYTMPTLPTLKLDVASFVELPVIPTAVTGFAMRRFYRGVAKDGAALDITVFGDRGRAVKVWAGAYDHRSYRMPLAEFTAKREVTNFYELVEMLAQQTDLIEPVKQALMFPPTRTVNTRGSRRGDSPPEPGQLVFRGQMPRYADPVVVSTTNESSFVAALRDNPVIVGGENNVIGEGGSSFIGGGPDNVIEGGLSCTISVDGPTWTLDGGVFEPPTIRLRNTED